MKHRLWFVAGGVALLIVLGSGVTAWRHGSSQPEPDAGLPEPGEPIPDVISSSVRTSILSREQRWAQAPMVAASSESGEIASAWRGTVRDVDGLLTEDEKESLIQSAARFIHAYSSETPDDYIALVESTPWLRWRTGADELASIAYGPYKYWFGHLPNEIEAGDAIAILRTLWAKSLVERNMRFDSVGIGETGALFLVQKTYTADQPSLGLESVKEDEADYWDGDLIHMNTGSFTATTAQYGGVDSKHEALHTLLDKLDRASLPVAHGHVLIKAANGVMFNWQTRWVLDPQSNEWVCDWMVIATGRPIHVYF